jgi:hypothetical protein
MKKMLPIAFLALALAGSASGSGAVVDGMAALARSDATLFAERGRWKMSIKDYEGGVAKRSSEFECAAGGVDRVLLVATGPAVLRGQTFLRLGDVIYHYVKKVDKLEQVPASAAFFNSAFSMEDVVSVKMAAFYDLATATRDVWSGKPCLRLELVARDRTVAYKRVVSWIDETTWRPLGREYYAFSGTLLKKLVFDEQRNGAGGKLEYLRLTMSDAIRAGTWSSVEFSAFDYATPVTDDLFTIAYMKRAAR